MSRSIFGAASWGAGIPLAERGQPESSGAAPAWLRVLAEAWDDFPGALFPVTAGAVNDADPKHSGAAQVTATDKALLNWIGPLAMWARERLRERVTAEVAESVPPPASHALFAPEPARLLGMVTRALVLELGRARQEGRLLGATPADRFADFAAALTDPEMALGLLADYPVLAHALVAHFRMWIDARAEFAVRLAADCPALRQRFGIVGDGLADLVDVEFGAGDYHRGGRSVAIVTFPAGGRVVYKPRDLLVETHFNELLRWVNAQGLPLSLRLSGILARPGYGWCAYIRPEPCRDAKGPARYYWRQGAYLALFYALRCYDLHFGNVIAAGEHPMYVDLETMFHAEPSSPSGNAPQDDPVTRLKRDSVLAVGLLPHRIVEIDEDGVRTMEISGLAGGSAPGELDIRVTTGFAEAGTDRMRVIKERLPVPLTGNRPVLDGKRFDPPSLREELVSGFTQCYRMLLARRDVLLRADGPIGAFRDDHVRVVLRNTYLYDEILDESWNPDLLRDAAAREYVIDRLTADEEHAVPDPAIRASEQRQLGRMDVPVFFTTPGSTALRDERGQLVSGYLDESGLQAVRRRLQKLSELDLTRQVWFVQASMATRHIGGHTQRVDLPVPSLPRAPISENLALAAASRIGDELLRTAVSDDAGVVEWPSVNLVGERFWVVDRSGLGLYSGVCGIVLFLAELGEITGDARYRRRAQDVVAALADPADMPEPEDLRGMSIGGYDDLGGTVYLLTILAVMWGEPSLIDAARQLVPAMTDNLASSQATDIISGAAGAALVLICLQQAAPDDRTLAAIRHCGRAVLLGLDRQTPPGAPGTPPAAGTLAGTGTPRSAGIAQVAEVAGERQAGFAHGFAGQAYALAAIGNTTGEAQFTSAALRTIELARGRFAAAERTRRGAGLLPIPDAWCRGAAGIVLASAGIESLTSQGSVSMWRHQPLEADAVRKDLLRDVGNDSLCHGTLGVIEALAAFGETIGDIETSMLARRAATAVAHRVLSGGIRTGVPMGVWSPGLMNGAAGIGHGLLHAATRQRVPSVLLLQSSRPGGAERP